MKQASLDLRRRERAVFELRALYAGLGYSQYKMSKFEEYDLYVRNKSFLLSDHIITFNDTDGRLLALKPDVTLSIVKNSKDVTGGVQKVYYNENVYRTPTGSREFREIPQVGLECMGEIDNYQLCEVLLLAGRSLSLLSPDFVLELSHLDVVAACLDGLTSDERTRQRLLACVGEKNAHDIDTICREAGVSEQGAACLKRLVRTCGDAEWVLRELRDMAEQNGAMRAPVGQLCEVVGVLLGVLGTEHLRLDFSLISDMSYYNGIVFKGYIKGIPTDVLSGGQYDGLMQRMGKNARAVGFAIYLDVLQTLSEPPADYDVDTVLLYDEGDDPAAVVAAAHERTEAGERVLACRRAPDGLRYRQALRWSERGCGGRE